MSSYAQVTDLAKYGLPAAALGSITSPVQQDALDAASNFADSKLRGRYTLPLLHWGTDLTRVICWIAAYDLVTLRGYAPRMGSDQNLRLRYQDALKWLDDVERQNTHPDVTPSIASPGDAVHDIPQVRSQPRRNWQQVNAAGKPSVG